MSRYLGEIAALTAAGLWATSSTIYGRLGAKIKPLSLNLTKGCLAIAYILITLWLKQELSFNLPLSSYLWLLLSGAIGIGLGDTAYFSALNHLGVRRTLLLETMAPPLAGLLAWLCLGEILSLRDWLGIILTILGVAWVISEGTPAGVITARQGKIGVIWGILAAIAQAVGVVIARYALTNTSVTPLGSALIRLVGGVLIILPLFGRQCSFVSPAKWTLRLWLVLSLTALMSTYLGIWLQQTALKLTRAGIASTLLATSPLFVLPIVYFLGEKITLRAIIGVMVSLCGIALLSWQG